MRDINASSSSRTSNAERYFLSYCWVLLGVKTKSLKRMVHLCLDGYPTAREAVCVWAVCAGKEQQLASLTLSTTMEQMVETVLQAFHENELTWLDFLESDSAPTRFRKVYLSYIDSQLRKERDLKVKALMAEKINELLPATGMTRNAVSKELKVNAGNLYSFLGGDATKLSRNIARKVWRFVEETSSKPQL